MQDRVSLYPGRVTLTPVAGQANTYDMVRADQPTQEGTQLNKGNLLSDATAELLGLPSTAVPNDAFAKLALGTGKYGYSIKVVDPSGNPLSGITVSGVETPLGQTAVTGENGTVLGVSTETSVSVSVTSPYFDLNSASQTVQSTGIVTEVTLTLTEKYAENEIITVSSSATARFSPRVKKVDFCVIGGGGQGARSNYNGGGGGGGGYVENLLDRTVSPEEVYTLTVGSGGTFSNSTSGSDGGQSSISLNGSTLVSANGGKGGGASNTDLPGGVGNGNGGTGGSTSAETANGKAGTVNLFSDASLGPAGGGGGGGGRYVNQNNSVCGAGGAPYGGQGANNTLTPAQDGRGPGGGGGGGGWQNEASLARGNGANGAIKLRMRFAA